MSKWQSSVGVSRGCPLCPFSCWGRERLGSLISFPLPALSLNIHPLLLDHHEHLCVLSLSSSDLDDYQPLGGWLGGAASPGLGDWRKLRKEGRPCPSFQGPVLRSVLLQTEGSPWCIVNRQVAYSCILWNVTLVPSWRVDWSPVTGGKYGVSMEANAVDWGLRMEGKTHRRGQL